jgi:hypothetical protein
MTPEVEFHPIKEKGMLLTMVNYCRIEKRRYSDAL